MKFVISCLVILFIGVIQCNSIDSNRINNPDWHYQSGCTDIFGICTLMSPDNVKTSIINGHDVFNINIMESDSCNNGQCKIGSSQAQSGMIYTDQIYGYGTYFINISAPLVRSTNQLADGVITFFNLFSNTTHFNASFIPEGFGNSIILSFKSPFCFIPPQPQSLKPGQTSVSIYIYYTNTGGIQFFLDSEEVWTLPPECVNGAEELFRFQFMMSGSLKYSYYNYPKAQFVMYHTFYTNILEG